MSLIICRVVTGSMRIDIECFQMVSIDDATNRLVCIGSTVSFHALFAIEGSKSTVGHPSCKRFLGLDIFLNFDSVQTLLFAFHKFIQSSLFYLFHLHSVVGWSWGFKWRTSSSWSWSLLVHIVVVSRLNLVPSRRADPTLCLFLFLHIIFDVHFLSSLFGVLTLARIVPMILVSFPLALILSSRNIQHFSILTAPAFHSHSSVRIELSRL